VTRTFAIVTTNANAMTAQLHDRIPVVLEQQIWSGWLRVVEAVAATLLKSAVDDVLKVWPASQQVNSPRKRGRVARTHWTNP
jgi:putative SOS response-associated peptidase YedK